MGAPQKAVGSNRCFPEVARFHRSGRFLRVDTPHALFFPIGGKGDEKGNAFGYPKMTPSI